MAVPEEQLAQMLLDAGNRLLSPPSSVEDLLPLLDEVDLCLERVDQSPSQTMQDALSPALKALVSAEVLGHSDADVKVYVATCISEITRITAPDAPYNDDQMKEIFKLTVSCFENLHDTASRSYGKRAAILETVAKVRSCVVMLDLECDDLILQMFEHFFKSVRDFHHEKVFASMERIMTLVLEESEDISPELLSLILGYLKKDDKNVDPSARRLGEHVLHQCSSKVEPYLVQAIKTLGVSLDDYHSVVTSVCQKSSGAVECNGGKTESRNSEEKETLKDSASQNDVSPSAPATESNDDPQKEGEEAEVVQCAEEHLTETKYDDHTENKAAEESESNKDEGELIIKAQTKFKGGKRRGRRGNLSKTKLAASTATDKVKVNLAKTKLAASTATDTVMETDAEDVTGLQESDSKDSLSLHLKDNPADSKREIKGSMSKCTSEPSEATPAEEGCIGEELTDYKESISNESESLHSKDTPTDIKRGGNNIFPKGTLDPFEPAPAEEDNDAKERTDLQEIETKDSLHCKDTPADNTSPSNCDKVIDVPISLPKASENKDVDIPSPSPSGETTEESHLQKIDRGTKTEAVKQAITSSEDNYNSESNPDASKSKEDNVTGQETSSATEKEDATLGPVDASMKDDQNTIDSDTKTTKLSGKKGGSVKDQQQDTKKIKRQGKTSSVKEHLKPTSKKECKEPDSSPKRATKTAKQETAPASSKKGLDQKSSNKKRVAGKEKASENENPGEELVGSTIKVWWPKDKKFYEGVVESFTPSKKHKVCYKDGDVEMLTMKKERWELVKVSKKGVSSDGDSPDALSEMHKKKKVKTNPETSNEQGKTPSAKKTVGAKQANRSKVAVPKPKLSEDEMDVEHNSDDEDSKDSGGSEDEKSSNASSGDESMDETPKGACKSKKGDAQSPKTSTKSKQAAEKCYSRSKGKSVTGSGSKNVNKPGKAKAGSSLSKGKETGTEKKSEKSSQSGRTKNLNTSSKAQKKVETKSGNKRKRGSNKK